MIKHPKPKRTMRRGLRPLPVKELAPPPDLSRRVIEQMKKILFDEVLANGKTRGEFDEQQLFVADYAYQVALFHRGEKTYDDIRACRERGFQIKFFDKEKIDSLAFVILEEKTKGQLEAIFERLKIKSQKQ